MTSESAPLSLVRLVQLVLPVDRQCPIATVCGHAHKVVTRFDRRYDFVVLALLNRGVRYRRTKKDEVPRRDPEFYVIPIDVVRTAHVSGRMSVVRLRDIPTSSQYLDNWEQIREFLGATS